MINDFDAKIIAPEEIKLTDNLDKASALTLEVNVHFVDKENTHSNELEINKNRKSQNKVLRSHGNARFFHILERIVFLRAELPTSLRRVLKLSIFMNNLLILMFWLRYLFNKVTYIRNKTGGSFSKIPRNLKLSLVSITSWL